MEAGGLVDSGETAATICIGQRVLSTALAPM